jgi:DNA-binding transcriptional MerR regulator
MSQSIGEGTKIAQAAKDLNVTSVTIRRYLSEFNVPTTSDESGIMVLPPSSVAELSLIRKLKEDSLGNQEILEAIANIRGTEVSQMVAPARNGDEHTASIEPAESGNGLGNELGMESEEETTDPLSQDAASTRPRHALTCQTCGKSFEHTNPRLRDCLDCYRSKRKERRRGAPRVVIQHPLAQQAATNKAREAATTELDADSQLEILDGNGQNGSSPATGASRILKPVRNYRKAVDETRHITSNLKRRLDRVDLPEGERKWLEQIYAYQLILHQGWRHLLEYRSAGMHQPQATPEEPVAANES